MAPAELGRPPPERGIFCNRTLNMRSIKAIGYDMDYTLIHYRVEEWETQAYEHIRQRLLARGWPVQQLKFDPAQVIRGLVIDLEEGNLVKANRFGFVKKAVHGTRPLDYEKQRRSYARTLVDLSRERWVFLNTLFSLSEACIFGQLVDLYDDGRLPEVKSYTEVYKHVRQTLDAAHMEGQLKAEILGD
ncbi:MAG: 5'-nucleotidase domain-containing protein, partial [Myxococcales bacterium]